MLININFPDLPPDEVKAVETTVQGVRGQHIIYADRRTDPRGGAYFWLGFRGKLSNPPEGTDLRAIYEGRISVTPLHIDLTHMETVHALKGVLGGAAGTTLDAFQLLYEAKKYGARAALFGLLVVIRWPMDGNRRNRSRIFGAADNIDFAVGASNALMVNGQWQMNWTAPEGNPQPHRTAGSNHSGGAHFVLGDGSVRLNDILVIISGSPMWVTGTTNLLKLHRVGERR